MTDWLGWVVAGVVGVLAILNRLVGGRSGGLQGPVAPPADIGAAHAKDAIQDAAQANLDEISEAEQAPNAATKLAALANRAKRRRSK